MRLFIVRHGETFENEQGIIQGQSQGRLSRKGVSQSKALAERLAAETLEYAYCSDLGRARDTMTEILPRVPIPCEYTCALRELHFGELEGRPVAQYVELLNNRDASFSSIRPRGGESYDDLKDRTDNFLRMLASKHRTQAVLICTHGWNARSIIGILMKLSFDDLLALQIGNASLSILDLDGDLRVTSYVIGDEAHFTTL